MNLVDELQEAFNAILAIPTEDIRSSAEQNTTRFIEAARKIELFFLQKSLLLIGSGEDPDEIQKLQAKLAARDNILSKYNRKLSEWKALLE